MNIQLTDLGLRLLEYRKSLEISQKDLAEELGVNQNQISRIENGIGGSIELLLALFNYYANHFHIRFLFSESFVIVRKDDSLSLMNAHNAIAAERLRMLKDELSEQLEDIINVIESE